MRKRLVVGVVLAVVVVAKLVGADDDSDRRDLLSRIDSKLDSAARELYSLERQSDASNVDDAQGYVREVQQLVEDLKRVKGDDSTANRVTDYYPDYIKDFRDASDALKTLKNRQNKSAGYLQQCRDLDAAMTAKASAAKDDPDGAAQLLEVARTTGRQGQDLMKDASSEWSEVDRNRNDAKRFSASEGHWSDVRSNLSSSADGIAQIWRDNWDKAKSACEEVVKSEHHRDVERALDKLSNSRAGRADMRRKIDEQLDSIAERIKDVQSQSDDSYVNGALDNTRELESLLDRLGNAAGDDRDARAVASTWPAWVKQLRESLEALKQMKLNQHIADGLAEQCANLEKALDPWVKQVLDDREQYPDPEQTIFGYAEQLAGSIRDGLNKGSDVDRRMTDWTDKAKRFSQSDGKWSRVSSNLRDSADHVFAYWHAQYDATARACATIALGKDSPKVKTAIAQWRGSATSSADQLERDVNAWVERARATYRLDCQAMDDLWQAYCGTDFEPNDPDADELPKQTAARLQDQMQAAMKPVLADLPALDAQVKLLLAKKETKSRGEALAAQLDKQRKRLHRLSVQDVWRGSNDPIRFQAAEYGKQRHIDKYGEFGCKVPLDPRKEARFPVSGPNKPDCIVPDKCEVWEFKPDSPKGREEGEKKKRIYADVVPAYYTEMYKKKESPPPELGGVGIMKTLVEKCLEGDHIVLNTEVDYYNMCEKHYECVGD